MRHTRGARTRRWIAALGLAALGAWSAHAGWFDDGRKTATGAGLSLATWNLEWLMTPATFDLPSVGIAAFDVAVRGLGLHPQAL